MKYCIVGAGAIGCFLAAPLAKAGHQISVLARGNTLAAIAERGIKFENNHEQFSVPVNVSDNAAVLGVQDVVLMCVKSPSLVDVVKKISALIDSNTLIVPVLNGVPWWFALGDHPHLSDYRINAVDPNGVLQQHIPYSQIVGSVVYPACSCPEPGFVKHASGTQLIFGEPQSGNSERVKALVAAFSQAGFEATASDNIRSEIWLKLLGNTCFNPVSLLTGSSTDLMIDHPGINALFINMMHETIAVGKALGIDVALNPAERLAITRRLGRVKTSMLQDVEAHRRVEVEGIMGALVEIGNALKCDIPLLKTVYALASRRAQVLGLD